MVGEMEMHPLDAGLPENVFGKLVCMRSCVKRNGNQLQTWQVWKWASSYKLIGWPWYCIYA